jgi:hypothetical protein
VWSRSIPFKGQTSCVRCAKRSSGSMIDTSRCGYKPCGPTRQGLRQPTPPGGAHIELHYCTGAQYVGYRPISIAGTHDPTLFGQIEADIQEALGLARNMAFPDSSLDTPVGAVYRFSLRYLVEVDNPCTMFRRWNRSRYEHNAPASSVDLQAGVTSLPERGRPPVCSRVRLTLGEAPLL